ncbi:MAG: membrane protein insertase YidC [Microthrixaceae bacterium]
MFEKFFDALASVLNFFFLLVPEGLRDSLGYGLSIILLTILVMVVITPLTVKSTRSMLQMQRLQPEMKRIQEQYKNDREQLNAELMAFYRENQINPLGGCLPMLAQAPVFFIMYRLIEGLTVRKGGLGTGIGQTLSNITLDRPFRPWVLTDQVFQPNHLDPTSELYKALNSTSKMQFFGMDLSLSASQALKLGMLLAIPYLLLLLVMLGTGLYQNRQLRLRNTSAQANPQQQMIMKFMPFFLPVISFGFPAGMALYWCTQNLCRIGTNAYINRSVYKDEHGKPIETTASEKTGDKKKNPTKAVDSKSAKSADKGSTPRTPGTSAKSQAAHKNAADRGSGTKASASGSGTQRSAQGKGSSSKVNQRRSGETRRKQPKKD